MNLDKCATCRHRGERVKLEENGVTIFDACHAHEAERHFPPCKYTRKEECIYQPKEEQK